MVGQIARVAIQFLGVVVLARLLSPTDYGLLAMVLAIVGVGEIFRDFGLSNAAIQARELSPQQRSNLFWINTAVGGMLTILAAASAPLVALIFGDRRLIDLTLVLSTTFLLSGISTQLRADLHRQFRFGRLAVAETGGQVLGLAVGIVMAMSGFGYWALAGQQIGQAVVALILLVALAGTRIQRYARGVPMRHFLGYGANLAGAQLLGYASKNVDTLIIGTMLGPGPLGLYNRAFQLLTLPLTQINSPSTRVALPVLSRLQDDKPRYESYLLTGQSVILNAVLAVFSLSAALAAPAIEVLLGPRWSSVAPLFQILAVAGVFQTAGYAVYWIFLSKGLTRSHLRWQLVSRPAFILIVVAGGFWGVTGVAAGYAIANIAQYVPLLFWIRRIADVPVRAILVNFLRALAGYAVCAAAAWAASVPLAASSPVLAIVVGVVVWIVAWVLVVLAWPAFRHDVSSVPRMVRLTRAPRSRPESAPRPTPRSTEEIGAAGV